ncbi:MAG: hypothetical protein NT141_01715 [candidate division WWE3 bacterium]|nr:hypothetical protein [candidate division WWE3 bacterium]
MSIWNADDGSEVRLVDKDRLRELGARAVSIMACRTDCRLDYLELLFTIAYTASDNQSLIFSAVFVPNGQKNKVTSGLTFRRLGYWEQDSAELKIEALKIVKAIMNLYVQNQAYSGFLNSRNIELLKMVWDNASVSNIIEK